MWKKILIGLGIVVVAIGSCVGYCYFSVRSELKPLVVSILRRLDKGEVAVVYLQASALFKRKVDSRQFRRMVEVIHQRLGKFEKVESVGGIRRQWGSSNAAAIEMRLGYQKGKAVGRFSFVKEGDGWKLLGFDLKIE